MASENEKARAMLQQALAEARARGARRITELHLVLYDASAEAEESVRRAWRESSAGTMAEGAEVRVSLGPSRFICWNCCGLRYESHEPDAVCPNCGHEGFLIPTEITFCLDHIEVE